MNNDENNNLSVKLAKEPSNDEIRQYLKNLHVKHLKMEKEYYVKKKKNMKN